MSSPRTHAEEARVPAVREHLQVLSARLARALPPEPVDPSGASHDAVLRAIATLAHRSGARSIDATLTPTELCIALDVDEDTPFPSGLTRAHQLVETSLGVPLVLQRSSAVRVPGPLEGEPAVAAAARVARSFLARIRAFELECIAGQDPEAVHQLRVGIRRLRTVLRLLEEEHPTARLERVVTTVRRLGDVAGRVRDHDVVIELVESIQTAPPTAREAFVTVLRARRETGLRRLRALLLSEEHDAAMKSADVALRLMHYPDDTRTIADAASDQVRRFVKRVGRRLRSDLTEPGGYHEVRRALRRLRDTVEVFGSVLAKTDRRWRKRLQPIQGLLGTLNDCDTALALLARAPQSARDARPALETKRKDTLVDLAAPLAIAAVQILRR